MDGVNLTAKKFTQEELLKFSNAFKRIELNTREQYFETISGDIEQIDHRIRQLKLNIKKRKFIARKKIFLNGLHSRLTSLLIA